MFLSFLAPMQKLEQFALAWGRQKIVPFLFVFNNAVPGSRV